jgi:hypothetical protein
MTEMGVGDAASDIEVFSQMCWFRCLLLFSFKKQGQFEEFSSALFAKLGPGSSEKKEVAERIEICENSTQAATTYRPLDEFCLSLTCTTNKNVLPSTSKHGRPHSEIQFHAENLRFFFVCCLLMLLIEK